MSASTDAGSRVKTSGLKSNDGCLRIPAPGREAGPEIDDGVERDLLRPEGVDDADHLAVVFERAVRLHVAERPARRQHRGTGDRRELREGRRRVPGVEHEDVVEPGHDRTGRRQSLPGILLLVALGLRRALGRGRLPRQEDAAAGVAQIDLDPRRGDEQAPSAGAEQHRRGIAGAVHVALPARLHRVERSAAIELHRLLAPRPAALGPRPAFAEAQHRLAVEPERQAAVRREHQLLHQPRAVRDANRQRTLADLDVEAADSSSAAGRRRSSRSSPARDRSARRAMDSQGTDP